MKPKTPPSRLSRAEIRKQAEAFAAYVLIPTGLLKTEVDRIVKKNRLVLPIKATMLETSIFENLPIMFGVSPVALLRRMIGENIISTDDIPF